MTGGERIMSTEELEADALKLSPSERARLAGRLLESLEALSEDEHAQWWAEEAERRNAARDDRAASPADAVLAEARTRLK
jgi:hypothetical protein